MLEALKDHILTLTEEVSYRENIIRHKKSLEITLWGLEEQIRLPENQAPQDQQELATQINTCQSKIINCNKLLDNHVKKLIGFTENFKLINSLSK